MKFIKFGIPLLCLFGFIATGTNNVYASPKTDFDFQWTKYRQNYAEFSLLKRDYLQNQTLDNQQKAVLSAKQTLLARDMAKAAYARYMIDLINGKNTGYTALNPVLTRLSEAAIFFDSEALLSQQIITPADLKKFATDYLSGYQIKDRSFFYGQLAYKIATLVRFQIDLKESYDAMLPKLPEVKPAPLKARLDEVPVLAANINDKIASLSALIIPEEEDGALTPDGYFSPFIKKVDDIRQLQLQLVNQFVDIDINYVQSKI